MLNNSYSSHWSDEAWEFAVNKIARTSKRISAQFPHASVNGSFTLAAPHWWTAGFWPGLLWLLYDGSSHEHFRTLAEQCEQKLDTVLDDYDRLDHDLGFMWTLTSISNYKRSNDQGSRRRALKAASHLAGRFNIKGSFIRAWNPWYEGERNEGIAIIDCLMNLPLLFWASDTTGDPRFAHIANAHLETVITYFLRDDGSLRHVVCFDPQSGQQVENLGGQGYDSHSAWSRGCAWGIYGFALAYHHTRNPNYLDTAKKIASYFESQLPEDFIPAWDFRAPEHTRHIRDSSAAACAACGYLLLAELTEGEERSHYQNTGENILESLFRNYGSLQHEQEEGLILHGTGHFPQQSNIDVPLIYGDYFFIEGLARLKGGIVIAWE